MRVHKELRGENGALRGHCLHDCGRLARIHPVEQRYANTQIKDIEDCCGIFGFHRLIDLDQPVSIIIPQLVRMLFAVLKGSPGIFQRCHPSLQLFLSRIN